MVLLFVKIGQRRSSNNKVIINTGSICIRSCRFGVGGGGAEGIGVG